MIAICGDFFRDYDATDTTGKCPSCGRDSWYCGCGNTVWAFTSTGNYPPDEQMEEFFAPSNRELFWRFVYQCAGLQPNRLNVGPYMAPSRSGIRMTSYSFLKCLSISLATSAAT